MWDSCTVGTCGTAGAVVHLVPVGLLVLWCSWYMWNSLGVMWGYWCSRCMWCCGAVGPYWCSKYMTLWDCWCCWCMQLGHGSALGAVGACETTQWRRKQGGHGCPTIWQIEATPTNLLHAVDHVHSLVDRRPSFQL